MKVPSGAELVEQLKAAWHTVWQDLRAKRLWPVALVLLLAMIAVPVLLSQSPSASAVPPGPSAPSPVAGLPAVSQVASPSGALHGPARNPFTGQPNATSTTSTGLPGSGGTPVVSNPGTTSTSTTSPTSTGGGSTTTTPTGGTSPGSSTGGSTPGGSSPGSGGKTPPSHEGLGQRQSYAVTLAITNTSGGINTLNPLERLSLLPSQQQPLMIELGVLQGGDRVLFALEPGTAVSGPGQCVPGPIDCQLISVGRHQVEHLGVRSAKGVTPVALFAVTGISAVTHASVSAAQKARRAQSAAGRALLNKADLSALSLFQYRPSVGVVVDMRNLTFGVN